MDIVIILVGVATTLLLLYITYALGDAFVSWVRGGRK